MADLADTTVASMGGGVETPERHWRTLARHTPLGIVSDFDGTLIPFAPTPSEAHASPEALSLLASIAALPGVRLALVSGRSRESFEQALGEVAGNVALIAEHGAWVRGDGAWKPLVDPPAETPVLELVERLAPVLARYPAAELEQKSLSVALHLRKVRPSHHMGLRVEVASLIEKWLDAHPAFKAVDNLDSIEVRPSRIRKGAAISWMRRTAGEDARLVILGDDITDEDMFTARSAADEAVVIGEPTDRVSAAHWYLATPDAATAFLHWIVAVRAEGASPVATALPQPRVASRPARAAETTGTQLIVISNRLPELRSPVSPTESRKRTVGGLVSALAPILSARSAIWLGWSGREADGDAYGAVQTDDQTNPPMAWLDLPERALKRYYAGFCNRALWPLFHSFPARVNFDDDDWRAYVEANDAFANAAIEVGSAAQMIWVHDYHLFLVARALRRRGYDGCLGHFLHIPFPSLDLYSMLPWGEELLDALLDFDLLGFQTPRHVDNFRHCVAALTPARVSDDAIEHRSRRTRIGAFPIGTVPENYVPEGEPDEEVAALLAAIKPTRLVLGVDRLDYTKGIPARLQAFGRLLALEPEWRGKVSLVQVSVPSRGDIPDYAEQRAQVEAVVGRINGEYSDGHWVPIRYLYRSFTTDQLAHMYRAADVGLVTPLRDGMNLVAKEFVAAQSEENPGVLVLSRFAGAAAEMPDAVLSNPYHPDQLARDLGMALRMPEDERRARHRRLHAAVMQSSARAWASQFLEALAACVGGAAMPHG